MNSLTHRPDRAARAGAMGAAWLDSGILPGIVVVDANRPAHIAASRGGLLKQFRAAH
jgi:hypothetical protein